MTTIAPPRPGPVLFIAADLATHPELSALQERLRLRSAAYRVLEGPATPRALLTALRESGGDPARSWLASGDPAVAAVAGTAGLVGVVLVGVAGTDRDEGVLVRHALDLAGVTIAMVPRGGGCWHDQR
jgi:anti-sigma factor RsiW